MRENHSETAIRECRAHFLRAAATDPNILLGHSLDEEVFQPSQTLWAELGLPVPRRPSSEFTPEQWVASKQYGLKQWRLIEDWATRHHLPYEWVRRAASNTLAYRFSPENAFVSAIPAYTPPDGIWPPWAVQYESESDYRKRMRQAVNANIANVKHTRWKVLHHRQSQESHYRWAAEHVCLGWIWTEIARANHPEVTWQAVQDAVPPILQHIGIPTNSTS